MADTMQIVNEGLSLLNDKGIDTLEADLYFKLIKADFTLSNSLVYSDISSNIANFSGYADWQPTFGATSVTSNVGIADGGSHDFVHNGGGTANTIYGAALLHMPGGGPNKIVGAIHCLTTKTMDSTDDTITATVKIKLKDVSN